MYDANVEGAARIAKVCKELGIGRFIHASALRASKDAPSEWSRTKYYGELEVLREYPLATIIRPATIFGVYDRLLNGIGRMCSFNNTRKFLWTLIERCLSGLLVGESRLMTTRFHQFCSNVDQEGASPLSVRVAFGDQKLYTPSLL